MRYMVVLEKGSTSWGAHVPDLPGCIAVGETKEEAMGVHIEALKEDGVAVPPPSSESEFVEIEAA